MKPSTYNVYVPVGEDTVLYNTLYGSVTRITGADLPRVRAALDRPAGAGAEDLATLIAQRHVVPNETDELVIVRHRRRRGIDGTGRLDVIVMPTMECNFDCVYCYETRVPGRMSAAVEARLVRWLEREMPTATLTLFHWFGGEPLLDVDLVIRVTERCNSIAAGAGVRFWPHVTTNGALLSGRRRERLLVAGIVEYQVTLDGTARTHDRLRPFASGRPSFARVHANVVDALNADERVVITLRVNVNNDDLGDVPELLESFPEALRPRLRLALEPIFGDSCAAAAAGMTPESLSLAMSELYERESL